MDAVRQHYEAFPYPARDPVDEATRLITGSPSHPVEIDHFLFAGRRDWSQPFRALVAGGGTGDGLVMLTQKLADLGCPAEVTYIDMSEASREIAEARIAARGLSVRFITGDLLSAPDHGPFDYIDCCGVLHHLPDPDAGFRALAEALSPDGGMGLMVYAPHGRSGVYPLQDAFGALFDGLPPGDRIGPARAALERLPEAHPFRRNTVVGDHRDGDAGLYDLLLHSRDRAYSVSELTDALDRAGLALAGLLEPVRYDPMQYLPAEMSGNVKALDENARRAVGEQLAGNIKTHIAYAVPTGRAKTVARPTKPDLIPWISGVDPRALAREVQRNGRATVTLDGHGYPISIPAESAGALAAVGQGRTLEDIARTAGLDWMAFQTAWGPIHRALSGVNLIHYSIGAR
ncbi:MAG: class I SAM-dependent methyltransferase, partial [Pseudomonadota bacterium]